MKANELRIGNLVEISNSYTHRPKGYEVAHIHAINVTDCIIHWDQEFFTCSYKAMFDSKQPYINPIPLTEEWLIKFGFPNTLSTLDAGGDYEIVFERTEENKLILKSHLGGIIKEINHVHQLQNLYFALTGEELELKEEVKK